MYESMLNNPISLFGQFERVRREMDDVFGLAGLPRGIRSVAAGTLPAVNVGRTPTSIEIYAFALGIDAATLDVTLDRGVLRISGERASGIPAGDQKLQKVHVYAQERGAGKFTRTITLSDDIDPERVEARYRDGVIRVSVARRETTHPKRIAVQ